MGGLDVAHGTGDALVQGLELLAQLQHERRHLRPENRHMRGLQVEKERHEKKEELHEQTIKQTNK